MLKNTLVPINHVNNIILLLMSLLLVLLKLFRHGHSRSLIGSWAMTFVKKTIIDA